MSIFHPDDRARSTIDGQLAEAGWTVQSRDQMNLGAGLGVAVREFGGCAGAARISVAACRRRSAG
jgi:type I restriction enzyme R subunit